VLDVTVRPDPSDATQGTDGRLIADRYRLGPVVGRGGMATIYRAEDTRLGREVAIKLLRPEIVADRDLSDRFRREALAATVLRHRNIVGCLDTGTDPSGPFMVMELIDGEDLAARLRRAAPMFPGDVAKVGLDVARGLGAAHLRGIVHRDVKPGNILLARDGRAMITDFGIARLAADAEATLPGTTLGSVQYFSPEQALGAATTPASDVYGLGLVLYEALTGQRPWHGDSSAELALARVGAVAPSPRDVRPEVPRALDSIVTTALAPDPADRYPSGNAMAAALEPLVGSTESSVRVPIETRTAVGTRRPAPAAPRGIKRASARGGPRRNRPRTLFALAILALTAGGFAMVVFGADADPGLAQHPVGPAATARPKASPTGRTGSVAPTRTPVPTPAPADVCRPILDVACTLGAGRYAPASFAVPVSFALGDGWSTSRDDRNLVVLSRAEGLLTLASDVKPSDGAAGTFGKGSAREIVAAVAAIHGVKATKPADVRIDGHKGRSVDVTPIGPDRRALFAAGGRTYYAEPGRTTRLVALDAKAGPVLIVIEPTPDHSLRKILDTADIVASTIAFR
jgi:tRNA A-37 threonylcarbamoyl transferase component Bud32